METNTTLTLDGPAAYRLRLQGHVSAEWSDWLTDAVAVFEDDQTVVTGTVRDQAALFGLLSFVRDLGVPLSSVEFLSSQKEITMYKNITKIAFKGIALAMGIAVIVLGTLKTLDVSAGVFMLGFGLTALALANFQKE